jgi:chromosomal replication initiator protein
MAEEALNSMTEESFDVAKESLRNNECSINDQWGQICGQLRLEFGETAFESWLKPLSVGSLNDGVVNMRVPTSFIKNWVIAHYSDRIHKIWEHKNPEIKKVQFVVQNMGGSSSSLLKGDTSLLKKIKSTPTPQSIYGLSGAANSYGDDKYITSQLNPAYTFENFVVGKTNEFAYAAAKKVAESRNVSFNPLFLYSGVGLGKTHLMHAIAWYIKNQDPTRNVVYISAEQFLFKFVKALRYKDAAAFKEQFRSVDVLMIDDVQFLSNKAQTQEEFFYTFDSLMEGGRQIILSADKSPNDLDGIETRLKSRLNSGLVADIMPTDFDLRVGILNKKAEQLGIELPTTVTEFLAQKLSSNIRELDGSLKRIAAHSQFSSREITLEMTQDILKDMLRSMDRKTTIDEIQKKVAEFFNISVKEMQSSRRARNVARPRQIAMYLAKQLTSRSLPEIGRKFDRDHTTVMHAVRKVEELIVEDNSLAESVNALRKDLEN